jgi:hypothetical protein
VAHPNQKTRKVVVKSEKPCPEIPNAKPDLRVRHLDDGGFNGVICMMLDGAVGDALFVRNNTFLKLKELKVKRDLSKAVKSVPKTAHPNMRTFLDWMSKVTKDDEKAVAQIVAIDATAVARGG